jgi:hypothetical protein
LEKNKTLDRLEEVLAALKGHYSWPDFVLQPLSHQTKIVFGRPLAGLNEGLALFSPLEASIRSGLPYCILVTMKLRHKGYAVSA